jgi:1,4-dihydroxy-2-naphthoate octaprenyltransferase
MNIAVKLKAHLWTLPRWFAAPFFGSSVLLGAVLASGGINSTAWLALIACLLVMAGGHSWNSYLDYAWTGIDKGEVDDRSAEKAYTGGQNLIEKKTVSLREVLFNALTWYALSAIPMGFIIARQGWWIAIPWVLGMLCTFWYSKAKFTVWSHELSLGIAVGPLPVLIGMFAVSSHPPIINGLLVSVPVAIVLSFMGLALDEWPDAEANLKKGVKSMAYMVWKYADNVFDDGTHMVKDLNILRWYCTSWLMFMVTYHVFLISIGVLAPMTGIALLVIPFIIPLFLLLKKDFYKIMGPIVAVAALYPVILLVGQLIK